MPGDDARATLAALLTAGPCTVDDQGRLLWLSLDHAMTYASTRALVRKRRQRVVPVRHLGVSAFEVRNAEPEVAEPCS